MRAARGRVAVASPELAPYGLAAHQALRRTGLLGLVGPRLVTGADIGQAYQFVASGGADLGLVALSQVRDAPSGSWIEVPATLYDPIEQQAVLLLPGRENAAAVRFLEFLRGEEAAEVVSRAGYDRRPGS